MQNLRRITLVCLCLGFIPQGQAAQETIRIEEFSKPLVLWTPESGHIPEKWPAVIYYHGTSGRPSIGLMHNATGGENFILLGTTYIKSGRLDYSPENLAQEVLRLQKLKKYLVRERKVDPTKIYVAGFSKGGWATAAFLERDHTLAGGLVLGGGIFDKGRKAPAKPFSEKQKPAVFIGVGRYDGNYPQGLRALLHFRKLGAEVTMETWPELAHDYPEQQPVGISQWLKIEANPPDLAKEAQSWAQKRLSEIQALKSPIARWKSLEEYTTQPFIKHFDSDQKEKAKTLNQALQKDSRIIAEIRARKKLRSILRLEIRDRYVSTLTEVKQSYAKVAKTFPDTLAGQQAAKDVMRTEKLLAHTRKSSKQ